MYVFFHGMKDEIIILIINLHQDIFPLQRIYILQTDKKTYINFKQVGMDKTFAKNSTLKP
jgi:hypothetical protein